MKLYDISQEVFGCRVYPGDRAPEKFAELRMDRGDGYNLTSFAMCAHNGTHIDAPFHFLEEGDTVEQLPLEKLVGYCVVCPAAEDLTAEGAARLLEQARQAHPQGARRLLLKGPGVVTEAAARVFAGADLVGVEGLSVGPEAAPAAVHKILLGAKTVLLEGLRLEAVEAGVYFLCAAPLALGGSDGAPCRAVLIGP